MHGVAVDPGTREVYVNDRDNRRIQVFDENGKFLRMWSLAWDRANLHFVHIDADRRVWLYDQVMQRLIQVDREGRLLYSWGGLGAPRGALGRAWHQRRSGAEPVSRRGRPEWRAEIHAAAGRQPGVLVGKHVYSAWQ